MYSWLYSIFACLKYVVLFFFAYTDFLYNIPKFHRVFPFVVPIYITWHFATLKYRFQVFDYLCSVFKSSWISSPFVALLYIFVSSAKIYSNGIGIQVDHLWKPWTELVLEPCPEVSYFLHRFLLILPFLLSLSDSFRLKSSLSTGVLCHLCHMLQVLWPVAHEAQNRKPF